MKNLKYIIVFVLILSSGLTFNLTAQNSLIQTPVLTGGPYAGGTIISIDYSMEYTMLTGNKAELNITFPPTLAFVSSSLASNGMWGLTSNLGNNPVVYRTTAFTSGDNNYNSYAEFSVNFRVINPSCNLQNDNIVTTLSTIIPGGTPTDQVAVSTPISIQNIGSGVSVAMNLIQGDECSTAMYEINSFGSDTSSNSTFALTVPAGATLQGVFNTIGSPVAFAPLGSGPTTYSWSRSGISNENSQAHYVIIAYDQSILCQSSSNQLGLVFSSHNVCNPSASITASIEPYNILACCNQAPNTMNGVVLRKTLDKYPLRYFPAPNNCMTHDYIIKVDNLTSNNLNNFVLNDFLNDIVSGFSGEIEVTQITATFNQIFPSTPSSFQFSSSLGSYLPPPPTILSTSNPSGILYPNINTNAPLLPFLDSDFKITGSTVFPKYSTLTVKITHRLGVDPTPFPAITAYNNKALLNFKVGGTPYSGNVTLQSDEDHFTPSITLEKKVSVNGGPFSSSVTATSNDILDFQIRIRNYGMMAVSNVSLADIISVTGAGSAGNFFNPNLLTVTGTLTGYTQAELNAIQLSGTTLSGFTSSSNFKINAAPCVGFTELVITYQTKVRSNTTCSSVYKNEAKINFNGNQLTSFATVNVDLFKNITYRLVASCKGSNGPWTTGNINGIPGQAIWYKASLKNGNSIAVTDLKMMVQLPSQTSLSTLHPSLPFELKSTAPATPTGTNLHPEPSTVLGAALNNWLNTSAPLPSTPSGSIALYKVIPLLNPNTETTIIYKVIVPVNNFGTQYKTAMGVSRFSNSSCPIVKQTDLTLTVASSNDCGAISGCDLIMFDSKIERDVSNQLKYKVTLSSMLNSYSGFNVNNFDIVVHQPYTDFTTTTPYSKLMLGYKLNTISSVNPPFTFPLGSVPVNGGRRYHKVDSGNPSLNFGDINFDIITSNLPPSTKLTFPINLTFRDKSDPCFICERTILLDYMPPAWKPWNQLIQNDMLKSEKDPVNLSLNQARKRLQKSPSGAKIEKWYETLKKNNGIGKMLLKHPSDVVELFKVARKMIEKGGVLEQQDYNLIVKTLQNLNEISPAPKGLIDDFVKHLKSLIGQKWSMSIFDRWGNK